jgi:hypothetical protein
VTPKAGWDALEDRKVSYLYQEQNHSSSATQHMAQAQLNTPPQLLYFINILKSGNFMKA